MAYGNIQDGLATIRDLDPELVILDSRLSESEWRKFTRNVHGLEQGPSFLLITDSEDLEWNRDLGVNSRLHQISRPLNPEVLDRKVRVLLKPGSNHGDPDPDAGIKASKFLFEIGPFSIVGISKEIKQILSIVDKVAKTDVTVLIRGESGTGKELIARRIHHQSPRKEKPFIKVLCPAIPDNLLESELFGYERGSFTGAFTRKPGRFEFANEGTIFLDEIGDIPLSLQSKLLQVLQEGEFARIGGKADIRVNVRIAAATNKDLDAAVREGSFREDLYYRLNVVNIHVPPLRDRKEDIPVLAHSFLEQYNRKFNKRVMLSDDTLRLFMEYQWPGNVRELKHVLEGFVILGNEKEVVEQLQPKMEAAKFQLMSRGGSEMTGGAETPPSERRRQDRRKTAAHPRQPLPTHEGGVSLKAIGRDAAKSAEDDLIKRVLEQTRWNRKQAAKLLGISYKALLYKIKKIQKQ